MNFVVDGVRFMEVLWNALLFANKTGATKGDVHFRVDPAARRLYVVSCDDFIIVQDTIEVTSDSLIAFSFILDNASAKALEKKSRDCKETVDVGILTDVSEIQVGNFESIKFTTPDADFWDVLIDMVAVETPSTSAPADWYLNPDRLKNIPRMKIEGHRDPDKRDQPVAFRYISGEHTMLAFLYGPSVHGIITSMDESVLRSRGVAMFDDPEWVEPYIEHVVQEDRTEPETEESPPWEVDDFVQGTADCEKTDLSGVRAKDYKPDNLTARAEYDTPIATEAPDHVDQESWNEFGY